jgi:hypothetical protein
MMIDANMLDPGAEIILDRRKIEEIRPSPVLMMPQGLSNALSLGETLDLVAYLLSLCDRDKAMFRWVPGSQ